MSSKWVHCVCIVGFDLEIGHVLQESYGDQLSEEEKLRIAYLSFPDSTVTNACENIYSFRLRRTPVCSPAGDNDFLYCFTHFHQVPDASQRRGFYQRAFVICSSLPLFALFDTVVRVVGPIYHQDQKLTCKEVYEEIGQWDKPHPQRLYTLHIAAVGETASKGSSKQHNEQLIAKPSQQFVFPPRGYSHNQFISIGIPFPNPLLLKYPQQNLVELLKPADQTLQTFSQQISHIRFLHPFHIQPQRSIGPLPVNKWEYQKGWNKHIISMLGL
ncbi:MAG: hypothetical protein EZS28_001408 [Streblomastix strix]|uniref:UDENN domain-containing protein n=1 Tax=Streblomastix strix TaxID=222440 RepID=A0A5J4X8I1_9EUKA|nr:MAG: hypothetical protein EZS28_001408 [Streblomastix strix]